ncbi:hypothetical protein LCGC14_1659070, partial [marine sediment metagenome]
IMLGIFLITLVSASLGLYEQHKCVEIKTILNTTSVNISTISYPNSSIVVSNKEMTKNALTFNYSFCNTSTLGIYLYDYFDAEGNTYINDFKVTTNGKEFTTQNSIAYLGFILILLFTFFLTMYGAGRIEWKSKKNDEGKILTINNFKYVKVFLYTLAYFELMFLFGLSYKVTREADIEGFIQFFNFIYQLFLYLLYPLMIALIIIIFVIWINNKKLHERLKLGLGK